MIERSYSLLVNPISGGGAAPGAVVPVAHLLRAAGARVEVTYSPGPSEAVGLVEEAVARGDVVVSVGGDGMLSSLAGTVASLGGTLGIVPAGRGNDFARMLGLPSDPSDLADLLLSAEPVAIDLLEVAMPGQSPRLVAGSLYAGVDAVAAEYVDLAHRLPGRLQYPYAAVRALATYRPVDLRVVVDGTVHDFRAANVVVANSAFYGSGMKIAPAASLTDGRLDVIVIEAASRRSLIRSLPTVYDGEHIHLAETHVMQGESVQVSGLPAAPVGADGEPLGSLPATGESVIGVEVLPGAVQVLTPSPTRKDLP